MNETEEIEKLKKTANEYFAQRKYQEAEDTYTLALTKHSSADELRSVLLANRSAARIGLNMFELALSDAEESILIQPHWVKAYYRKASALEGIGKFSKAIDTWHDALMNCPVSDKPNIEKQLKLSQKKWSSLFLNSDYPIESEIDLTSRIAILTDKRERLSTLAHFWNDSSKEERYSYFELLISIIGGGTELSTRNHDLITPEIMIDMPLHNYADLTHERIALWCNYFASLSSERKKVIFEILWNKILNEEEKNDIIIDLKLLFSKTLDEQQVVVRDPEQD